MAIDPTQASLPVSQSRSAEPAYWRTGGDEVGAVMDTRPAASDFSFDDFVDFINPLHHLPMVGDFYREMTGDTIRPDVKAAGSAFFGGPIGLITGVARAMITAEVDHSQAVASADTGKTRESDGQSLPGIGGQTAMDLDPSAPMNQGTSPRETAPLPGQIAAPAQTHQMTSVPPSTSANEAPKTVAEYRPATLQPADQVTPAQVTPVQVTPAQVNPGKAEPVMPNVSDATARQMELTTELSPVQDLILRGLNKYDAFREKVG